MKKMTERMTFGKTFWQGLYAQARNAHLFVMATAPEPSLYQMREQLAQLSASIREDDAKLARASSDPNVAVEDLEKIQAHMEDTQKRYDMLRRAADNKEARDRASMQGQGASAQSASANPEGAKKKARGAFYAAAVRGGVRDVIAGNVQALGAIPEGNSGGENFLPSTLQTEIIHEAFESRDVLTAMTLTEITGLSVPRAAYSLDDDADVNDGDEAKDLDILGATVDFGRHKTKVKASVSDTVLNGTDVAIESFVTDALQSGIAAKTLRRLFAVTPKTGEEHMSVYATGAGTPSIKRVTGTNVIDGILAALGDLDDEASANAAVIMRRADYYAQIRNLANGASTLWGATPQDVIGVPVYFSDRATKPIVGDLRKIQINYDMPSTYDVDKNVNTGMHLFVVTTWDDIQTVLPSALRVVDVTEAEATGFAAPMIEYVPTGIENVRTVASLPTSGRKENVVYVLTAESGDKPAGSMWTWDGTAWEAYTGA